MEENSSILYSVRCIQNTCPYVKAYRQWPCHRDQTRYPFRDAPLDRGIQGFHWFLSLDVNTKGIAALHFL